MINLISSYPHCLFTTSFEESKRRQVILERVQKEMSCEPSPVTDNYLWPFFSNRKQREKLSHIQRTRSEESIVEQLSALDDPSSSNDFLCEDVWIDGVSQHTTYLIVNSDTATAQDTTVASQDTTSAPQDTTTVSQDTIAAVQDTTADGNIIENPQYIIQDSSSCDIQDTSVHHIQDISQDTTTNDEFTDQEVEDCIRELLSKGVSTVR